jgi:hypothetical protein
MATFSRADDLRGAEFVEVNLRGARFVGSDLSTTADGRWRVAIGYVPTPPGEVPPLSPMELVTLTETASGKSHSFQITGTPEALAITADGGSMLTLEAGRAPVALDLVARNLADGTERWRASTATVAARALAVADDGTVATIEEGQIVLRAAADGSIVTSVPHELAIDARALAFSADAKRLAVAGGWGTPAGGGPVTPPAQPDTSQAAIAIIALDAAVAGLSERPVVGTSAEDIAFDGSGTRLAVTTTDLFGSSIVSLFDAATGERIGTLAQGDRFADVGFTADSTEVVTVGPTSGWMRWPATSAGWQRAACSVANRDLTAAEWQTYLPGEAYDSTCGYKEP